MYNEIPLPLALKGSLFGYSHRDGSKLVDTFCERMPSLPLTPLCLPLSPWPAARGEGHLQV
jgi:hypothetical protein